MLFKHFLYSIGVVIYLVALFILRIKSILLVNSSDNIVLYVVKRSLFVG